MTYISDPILKTEDHVIPKVGGATLGPGDLNNPSGVFSLYADLSLLIVYSTSKIMIEVELLLKTPYSHTLMIEGPSPDPVHSLHT